MPTTASWEPEVGEEEDFLKTLLPSQRPLDLRELGGPQVPQTGVWWGQAGVFSSSLFLEGATMQLVVTLYNFAPPREPSAHHLLWDRAEDGGLGLALPGPTPAPPSVQGSPCLHTDGQPGAWQLGHTVCQRSPCPPGCDRRRNGLCVPHHTNLSTWRNKGHLDTPGRWRGYGQQ